MFPSDPAVIPYGDEGTANSSIAPAGVILPILFARVSVNHMLPSGPLVMSQAPALGVAIGNSTTVPPTVLRPMLCDSVNHRLPSAPLLILIAIAVGTNS